MGFAPAELVDEPTINGSNSQLADKRACVTIRNLAQNPVDFTGRKIGIEKESRALLDESFLTLPAQGIHKITRSPVLPHDGWMHRLAGRTVPDHHSLTLVCDACGGNILRLDSRLRHRLPGCRNDGVPDLRGVVLNPTGLGKMLGELALGRGNWLQEFVVNNRPRTRRSLVEGKDVFHKIKRAQVPCEPMRREQLRSKGLPLESTNTTSRSPLFRRSAKWHASDGAQGPAQD